MIDSCTQVCTTLAATSYDEPPAPNVADSDPDAEANAVIAEFGQSAVSDATGTTYATALAGLNDNYAKIPKDSSGYVSVEGLQQMVDHPESFAPQAVAAAAYFLDEANAGQADALETSRERYAEDKYNPDGEISKEDIESELAHLGDTEQTAPQTEEPDLSAYQYPQYPDGSDGASQDYGLVGDAAQPQS